ncbi:unnamed protein product, partial [Laminaria digitata]
WLLLEDIAAQGEIAARRLVGTSARGADDVGANTDVATTLTDRAESTDGTGKVGGDGKDQAPPTPHLYRQTLDFLARLAEIASSLTSLSKEERTPTLKLRLAEVRKEFLEGG